MTHDGDKVLAPRRWRQLKPAVPRGWTVIVLADRGLYGRWLFWRIVRLGWHPFLRINTGGTFRPESSPRYRPLTSWVPEVGTQWSGRGTAFKGRGRQLACTLLARWAAGYQDPWLILTDLPPETSEASGDGRRAWIEQGFKITKREGGQWQRTRMSAPARASRLWLAVAVATLWLLSVGGEADEAVPESPLEEVTAFCPSKRRSRRETRLRLGSVFRRGWIRLLVALIRHEPLPEGRFVPEAWSRAHERASTMPRLHRAKPVAWVLLRWGKWVMRVERQGSTVSWQNMAFLLGVADGEISRSMPQGGESNQPAQKPTPDSLVTRGQRARSRSKTRLSSRAPPKREDVGRAAASIPC